MTRPTIIMIHGFRGTHHGLARIAEELGDTYRLIIPDIPGFDTGEQLDDYSLDSYVSWLHRFVTEQKLTAPPILLGHSFGSIISAAYAAKYPDTIEKLILVNPIGAPALEGPKAIMTRLAVFYYWVGEKLPAKLAHPWLAARPMVMIMSVTMAKTKDKNLRKYIHSQHLQYFSRFHSAHSVSESFKTSTGNSVRDTAAMIPVSTLLIAGDKDDVTPLHKQEELVALFPDARLEVIKDVGHLTHYETPDQIARFVNEFIASPDRK